ncbi:16S rRNA (uracil(1498)-N(3))-methyltransferase [Labilibaculum sp. A4]|uniref:Ribosomal RNA small subunit methyltransferase E n=1 Tax=Labilibaculum euxinus TaxID=2686357 RepID=A0A425YBI2_9BACT|nr:16S rRNA (uracil(1498)-N(3))-methyltransferase [Labilibaculum euxinus]MDQ1771579.1 16S rRNA (uracil(1498)-N(3))-methyltransferase [Labilibaculum euxinus]MUP38235.1 16S rRNA (uracil(1498)-N(3))-methyltransferase [Labilibaculum euxinus]MVB07440.1 16S rRNA (uracil(1498)-N(3))-methyltransferase [Labilibaculum euxinus]MWN76532.1 16S rRNA (uracil(1498)-N(3))-methyltransferase [Labilibaculum euxinus]
MNLFYTPDIQNQFYQLNEIESKHCIRVLRLKEEDIIHLIDGKGSLYKAKIIDAHPKRCTVECIETQTEFGKLNYKLHIALAPTKNMDRTEWFMEKCTEIGIHEFTPLLCQHSERKVVKHERLFKVITSAVKQSLKAYHPILNEQTKFSDLVTSPFDGEKYIAHCNEGEKTHLKNLYQAKQNALILIGPEGDFSIEEVNLAKENGFKEISLGESRLRTETAGVVACNIISLENQ